MSQMKDLAHQYREKYWAEKAKASTFSYMICSTFFKYVAPSIIMVLLFAFAVFSYNVQAEPQGFSNNVERSAPKGFGFEPNRPNTISGVLHNGSNNDYVLLVGHFIANPGEKGMNYQFVDAAGDKIAVQLAHDNTNQPPFADVPYYIWGTIKKSIFSTSINIIEYTQK